jgi:hypothetical protein
MLVGFPGPRVFPRLKEIPVTEKSSKASRAAEEGRRIQAEVDEQEREGEPEKKSPEPMQAGQRDYPAKFPAQHLTKPGSEKDLRVRNAEAATMLDEGRCQTSAEESVSSAEAANLRFVSDDSKGIARKRRGKAFQYLMPSGVAVKDRAELARIRKLAIPPAWTEVWICPSANGHIQATGRDARARNSTATTLSGTAFATRRNTNAF